jgi:uncharacterized LabA/DUF88 family protein
LSEENNLAVFIDFENLAIGVEDANYKKFDVHLVLERLLEKGKVVVKRAYADWERYSTYKRGFHEAAVEMMDIPRRRYSGKNSADIRLVVDAMDLAKEKSHINVFVIASGDSDFSPLVSKLRENNKYVMGLGVKNSTSNLFVENCDEFIFYDDLIRRTERGRRAVEARPDKQDEAFNLLLDALRALRRENKEILWSSMVKETMKRKRPSFNEEYYGFDTFSALLEEGVRRNIIKLEKDQRSGSYVVTDFRAR